MEQTPRHRVMRRIGAAIMAVVLAVVIVGSALAGLTVTGYLPLSRLEGRVAEAVQERLGKAWQISVSRAGLTRREGQSMLVAENVVLRHPSGFAVRAPEGAFSYDPFALLRGRLQLSGVDLKGLSLSLAVDDTGAIELRSDDAAVKMPVPPQAESSAPLALAMALADEVFAVDGQMSWLNQARIRDASLVLIGPDGTRRNGLSQVDVAFTTPGDGERRITFSGVGPNGRKHGDMVATSTGWSGRKLVVNLQDVDPADVLPLVVGSGVIETQGLKGALTLTATRPDEANALVSAAGEVNLGRGTVAVPQFGISPIAIDSVRVGVTTDGGSRLTGLPAIEINAGATRLTGRGQLDRIVSADWRASLTMAGQIRGEGTDPPIQIDAIDMTVAGDMAGGLIVERAAISGPKLSVAGNLALLQSPDGTAMKTSLRLSGPSDSRAVIGIWPPYISPQVREMVASRLDAGQLQLLDIDVDLDPAAFHASMNAQPVPDSAVLVVVSGRGIKFRIGSGLPPLGDAVVSARATGRTLAVKIDQARAEISRGYALQISEGQFRIADTFLPRTPASAEFRATGGVDSLAALLALPVLKEFAPAQIDPQIIKGNVDLKTSITVPLAEDLRASEVIVNATGPLTQVASEKLFAPEKLEAGQFTLTYERGTLGVKGEARVSGQPAQIDVKQNARGQGEASVTMTLDQAARQRRGVGLDNKISGPVGIKIVKALTASGDGPIRVEADLTRAGIDGLVPGWSKPAGRAGRLSFIYDADKDGIDLEDLALDSAPLLLRGKVTLNTNQQFEQASFMQAKLSAGDDLKLDVRRDGNLYKASVRGAVMDVRPFLRGAGDGKGSDPDVDIDLAVPILTGYGSEQITNATLKLALRNGDMRSVAFEGRMGRSPLSIKTGSGEGARQITVQAADGGGLLRFFDYYRRAFGGQLDLTLTPASGGYRGSLLYRDFTVRNEPALRRVMAETQGQGGIATDRPQSGGAARNAGTEVQFTKLRGDFTRVGQRFDLRDTVIWGPLIGFTMQGQVDYGRDRIDLAGTFVPSYALNNAFSQVPIIGRILGGGQYEGLFAVNFRLTGAASNPTLNVNPLSAIAPGILRRFVDPFGGATGQIQ